MLTLRYLLNRFKMGNDTVDILYDEVSLSDVGYAYGDTMLVTLTCPSGIPVKETDTVSAASDHVLYDPENDSYSIETETAEYQVSSVDADTNSFTIAAPKYKPLECDYVSALYDETDGIYLTFGFTSNHMLETYIPTDDPTAVQDMSRSCIYVYFGDNLYAWLNGLTAVDGTTVKWHYDPSVENVPALCSAVFDGWDPSSMEPNVEYYGDQSAVSVKRTQTMWNDTSTDSMYENPSITAEIPRLSVEVPIQGTEDVRLDVEDTVRSGFVTRNVAANINGSSDMERMMYKPAFMDNGAFGLVRTINFNLHFRTHSGEDWMVENGDTWNFIEYGSGQDGNTYYSYDNESNQSDLLAYAGFTNNDVKYQKNKLRKSFLRLAFYDSDIPGTQNLLAYSSVPVDSGRLYSRYMNSASSDIYRNLDGDILTGARVDREVDEYELADRLGMVVLPSDDTVEEYRLSSRISVSDPTMSDRICEGFNIYLWTDSDDSQVPSDLYMKATFNHAGYGRAVPMMAPFRDSGSVGFKTNGEIAQDWASVHTQYGAAMYNRYSYIKLKYMYDKDNRRHVYYLDPDRYGTVGFGETININLYEARVAFND